MIAIYDLLSSRTLTGREIFIALAGQSGVRFGQHPTPEVPVRKSPTGMLGIALAGVLAMAACSSNPTSASTSNDTSGSKDEVITIGLLLPETTTSRYEQKD